MNRDLEVKLRTGRALYRPRKLATDGRVVNRISNNFLISERPPEAADRAVPGHWEGDLIVGTRSSSQIGTLIERSTRLIMRGHASAAVTLDVYSDLFDNDLDAVSAAFDPGIARHTRT